MGALEDLDRVSRTISETNRRVNQVENVARGTSSLKDTVKNNWKILAIGAAIVVVGVIVYYAFFRTP